MVTTPRSGLLSRTANVIYLAAQTGRSGFPAFESLSPVEQQRYENMAAAALREAYLEPVAAA